MVKEKTRVEHSNDISMDTKKALTILLGIDFSNFDEVYEKSIINSDMFDTLEKAKKVKSAYYYLKEKFDWKDDFSIYRYENGWYSIEHSNSFKNAPLESDGIEKIE